MLELEILRRYGVSKQVIATLEPHRDDHGLWRVKFSGPGAPSVAMDVGGSVKLAVELREGGMTDLADRLDAVIATTKRFAAGRQY
jgi:hypothetical protein